MKEKERLRRRKSWGMKKGVRSGEGWSRRKRGIRKSQGG